MRTLCILSLLLTTSLSAQRPDSLLAPTPPMGFISWNLFEGDISEEIVQEIADAMVESGLRDAGYEYVIIDDLWHGERDANGVMQPDSEKFPNGMKAVGDYLHDRGLKFGIYTDIAEQTCAGEPGSLGYESIDAETYASWGVDYIKCDYCYAPEDLPTAVDRYGTFIDAVRAQDRDMVFAICEWGQRSPWLWGEEVGGQLWRTTWDLRDTWEHGRYANGYNGIMEGLDRQEGLAQYAGPGHWNDPDMLVIGLNGEGSSSGRNGAAGCTPTEYESQMGLWCLLAAPLLMTNDVRNMDDETRRILLNKEVIAINQDPLGRQAERVQKENEREVWAKPLAGGSWAVGLLNRADSLTQEIAIDLAEFGMEEAAVRDVWRHEELGRTEGGVLRLVVAPHETRVVVLRR